MKTICFISVWNNSSTFYFTLVKKIKIIISVIGRCLNEDILVRGILCGRCYVNTSCMYFLTWIWFPAYINSLYPGKSRLTVITNVSQALP